MRPMLSPRERLVVSFDQTLIAGISPELLYEQVLTIASAMAQYGVTVKLNTLLDVYGYLPLMRALRERGVSVFVDRKLSDTSKTHHNYLPWFRLYPPKYLTVMCSAGCESIVALRDVAPQTTLLGVTVLTSLKETEVHALYGCSIKDVVLRLAKLGYEAGLRGFVCAPAEISLLREVYGEEIMIVTPGVRPWGMVNGDNQNPERVATPYQAIEHGADVLVVGRPIIEAPDPERAMLSVLAHIHVATEKKLQTRPRASR